MLTWRAAVMRHLVSRVRGHVRVEKLRQRSLIEVTGEDSFDFLQNLVTNDLRALAAGSSNLVFALFLNTKGKVIHDAMIYRTPPGEGFLVESDISAVQALQMHLKMFKMRRNVEIKSVEHEMCPWVVFDPYFQPGDTGPKEILELGSDILVAKDPRLDDLGYRIIAPRGMDVLNLVKGAVGCEMARGPSYTEARYKLGVGEGIAEIPYSQVFPVEANADFLKGMSTKKGVFVGKAVMKNSPGRRLMPIILGMKPIEPILPSTPIEDVKGRRKTPVGTLVGICGDIGLGLMRCEDTLRQNTVRLGSVMAQCLKPYWWPKEDMNPAAKSD